MFSPKKLIQAIHCAKTTELTTGFYKVQANDDLATLLKTLNINWDKAIVKYEALKNFAKDWYTTK